MYIFKLHSTVSVSTSVNVIYLSMYYYVYAQVRGEPPAELQGG